MWYPAEIVLKSYMPSELEVGMLFTNRISVGVIEPFIELFELEEIPEDPDEFMAKHGCPIELAIIDEDGDLLASHDELAWWDDGPESDEYRDITLDDINYILRECEGYVDIQIEDGEDFFVTFIEDKVILSLQLEEDELEE